MKTLGYALSVLVAVLIAGSTVGGAASLVWLLLAGEWRVAGMGLGLMVAALLLAPALLLPSRLLVTAADANGTAKGLAAAANAWAALALAACLLAVFWILVVDADPSPALAGAVWSYAVATLPWIWLAYRQDQVNGGQGGGMALLAILGKMAYAAALLSYHYGGLGTLELGALMLLVTGLGVPLSMRSSSPGPREDETGGRGRGRRPSF